MVSTLRESGSRAAIVAVAALLLAPAAVPRVTTTGELSVRSPPVFARFRVVR